MYSTNQLTALETIQTVFNQPILCSKSIDYGDDFFIVEINKEWIFRFPRGEYGHRVLAVEKKFLPVFQAMTSIQLPDYCYGSNEFGGYHKLPGIFLSAQIIKNLPKTEQNSISCQLGDFLTALHTFPINQAQSLGIKTKCWPRTIKPETYKQILSELPSKCRYQAEQALDSYFNNRYQPSVIHGDLSLPDHVLYDRKLKRISGIIDFGDMAINDAAHDFLSIYEHGGLSFTSKVLEAYAGPSHEGIIDRIRIELFTRPIFHAAYCLLKGRLEKYQEQLGVINKEFAVWALDNPL